MSELGRLRHARCVVDDGWPLRRARNGEHPRLQGVARQRIGRLVPPEFPSVLRPLGCMTGTRGRRCRTGHSERAGAPTG
ncbi:hypothetical protein C8259_33540 [Nocardia nova]|uniref:Uncharacterized protein n=1 Tax=Nocardia nova TaxID=37330 RepID=A0A2T2YQC0_9NOCA|nr:hypothetical protein C8259_33540 [Nocardia nova]